jgi:citrate/tricarballylate utilization protein
VTPLETLIREAATFGDDIPVRASPLSDDAVEVARVMQICNACRYCEGFCAVFPAMTRRLIFERADIDYLANLCHNCGACLHACQYATPHEFAVNVPRAMARARAETYARYAWPPAFGALYRHNGLTLSLALTLGLTLFLLLGLLMHGSLWMTAPSDSFYAIFPHNLMVALFLPIFAFAVLALTIGVRRFWQEITPGMVSGAAAAEATSNVLRLKYLDGGHGEGCNETDDRFTLIRRRFHHMTFYGFMLCFAATSVATLYHYVLGKPAPYGYLTLPKVLGLVGGVALAAGTVGLFWLNLRRVPAHGDTAQQPMDLGFIALLFCTALSGLVLMALRGSRAMPALLAMHLGAVMALFLTLPYSKFAHGAFRGAALLNWAIERRRPSGLQLSED